MHDGELAFGLGVLDLSAAAAQVAHDVTLVIVRGGNFHGHDRLEEDGLCFLEAVLHGENGRHGESVFVGINVVVGTIEDFNMDVDDGITGDDAVGHRLVDAFVNRVDIFFRNGAADDFVLDGESLAFFVRLNGEDDVTVLAAAAGLLDQLAFAASGLSDGLAVGDLRSAGVSLDLELAADAVDDDLQVEFTHSGNDRLPGFLVGLDHEGRILFGETAECHAQFFLVGFGTGFDGHRDDRFRESRGLENHVVVFGGEGIAGGDILDADHGGDVTGVAGVDVLMLVRLDLNQTADALGAAGAGIVNRVALADDAGINAEENQFANELVGPEFESEGNELFVVRGDDFDVFLVVVGVHADRRRNVERAWEVVDHRIKQILDTFVFKSGATGDRHQQVVDRGAADALLELFESDRLLVEEFFAHGFIDVGDGVDEFVVSLFAEIDQIAFKFLHRVGGAELVVVGVVDRLLVHHVDLADQLVFGTDRDQDAHGVGA